MGLERLGPGEGKHRPIECQVRGGPVKSSARFVPRAARSGGPAAALPRRRFCACCYAATREPRSPLGSPRGSCRKRLARGGKEDERGGQGKVEAEDVGAAGGEGGLTARAEAAVNLREGARDVWRRGRGRGSGRAQSAVGSLHTCTVALLEGDVIDEAACIDVRRIRLRAGTLVECTPGLGVGTGVGVAISRSRRDLAAAHVSQIELAPATYNVVELVARLLAKVRAGAGVDGGVEGSSTREQGPCCRAVQPVARAPTRA